jgi:hypothetical protein
MGWEEAETRKMVDAKKKNGNHFTQLKWGFSGQLKMFLVWPRFFSFTKPKNRENLFP